MVACLMAFIPFRNSISRFDTPGFTPIVRLLLAGVLFVIHAVTVSSAATTTGWPLEILSFDLSKAYPGIPYEWRLGVKGGVYPYTFALISGPSGMSVDSKNGIIFWTPPATASSGYAVQIRITDSRGATLNHSYSIDVTGNGFFFVATNGNDGNAGTKDQPWLTLTKANTSAGNGGIIYVRAGTYSASGLGAGKWFAYPGETVIWDCGNTGNISPRKDSSAYVGFEIRNSGIHLFHLDGNFKNAVWRKNKMHGINAGSSMENPAFIFFMDGNARPIEGTVQYDRIVVQENKFYDLVSTTSHAASLTGYNLKNLLYEDNESYNIGGRGVSDKDDGYYNTFRNNVLHDCGCGVGLFSQYTQGQIEICYNLIYNCETAIQIGSQPGFIKDIYIHHNTLVGGNISFGVVTDDITKSNNWSISNNIIINDSAMLYSLPAVSTGNGYRDAKWVTDPVTAKVAIDSNLLWTTGHYVAGLDWGIPKRPLADWRGLGFDVHSIAANPNLTASYSLPAGSPYAGKFGWDLGDATIMHQRNSHVAVPAMGQASGNSYYCDLQGRQIKTRDIKSHTVVMAAQKVHNKIAATAKITVWER